MNRMLVTGGAGFIGSHFVDYMLDWGDVQKPYKHGIHITVLDNLTYAGNLENLKDSEVRMKQGILNGPSPIVIGDICDEALVDEVMKGQQVVVNFAAESHVDRSIKDPLAFVRTNVLGTQVLLNAAIKHKIRLFVQVSTDEVYGNFPDGYASEKSPLNPSSPYSASKTAAEHLCLAAYITHNLPVVVTRGSNTFGPRQYPEKLIPVFISKCIAGQQLPLYADGKQRREWLYVTDHCAGIHTAMLSGVRGDIYNIGGGVELENIHIARRILANFNLPDSRISYVQDRPGHDFRYAMNSHKLRSLGWNPSTNFSEALDKTIAWYKEKYEENISVVGGRKNGGV